jgi:outer membrane protein
MTKSTFFKSGLFLLTLAGISSPPAEVHAEGNSLKIVYVDLQKALEMTKEGQKVQKQFKTEVDDEQKRIDKKKAEFEKLKEDLDKQRLTLNETALQDKEEELLVAERELKRSFQDSQERLRRKNASLVGELVQRMRTLVETLGKEEGYSYIMERNAQGIVYADSELDITETLVKKFDAQTAK